MAAAAYPLSWPPGFPRSKVRESSRFKTTLPAALDNVERSLKNFIADANRPGKLVAISSNYSLGDRSPSDSGVAVWFEWDGEHRCIAVDRYRTIAENLQAVHHIIEARRTELRHGTLHLVRATFEGFKALPAPPGEHWADVLGVPRAASRDQIEAAYRDKARVAHPDVGGSADAMSLLNRAKVTALREIAA